MRAVECLTRNSIFSTPRSPDPTPVPPALFAMTSLDTLENESVFLLREAYARVSCFAVLCSPGKGSGNNRVADRQGVFRSCAVSGRPDRSRQETFRDGFLPRALCRFMDREAENSFERFRAGGSL